MYTSAVSLSELSLSRPGPYWAHFSLALFSWLFAFVGLPMVTDPTGPALCAASWAGVSHLIDQFVTSALTRAEHYPSAVRVGFYIADYIAFFFVVILFFIRRI